MKICISGAHSTGKTTLVNALKEHGVFKSFQFKTGLTRDLQKTGLNINEAGDDVTQLFVMSKHYEYSKIEGDVVLDRCALDGFAYSSIILKEYNDRSFLDALGTIGRKCFDRYDHIFYVRPELKLVDDGVRTVDPVFYENIKQSFNYWLNAIKTFKNPVPVTEVYGSVEQRVNQILTTLNLC